MNPTATTTGWAKYWLPEDLSTHGHGVDSLINFTHWFMLLLFVAWAIFLVYCLIRFRAKANPQATYEPAKAKPSKWAEIAVVVIEIVLLVGFSMPVWAATKQQSSFPKPEEALTVRIVAQQFQWNVHYPGPDGKFGRTAVELVDAVENVIGLDRSSPNGADDLVTPNWLRVPKDKPVIVRLTSLDVIHSFWIPVMRVKQDVIPGMEIPVWFQATRTTEEHKTYNIACAQLCGLNHYSMRGYFVVMTQQDWDTWQRTAVAELEPEDEGWGDEDDSTAGDEG